MEMKAIELYELKGVDGLRVVDIAKPTPNANEVLIEVKAAGVNYYETELINGNYPLPKPLPLTMGAEASGIVMELGSKNSNFKIGDRITGFAPSGGYAEFATIDAASAFPIPDSVSFAQATTIPIQGLSAYTLLRFAAKTKPDEVLLIQASAGGVGLYLVQLAKMMGVKHVIGLASSAKKLELVKSLGADTVMNYSESSWVDHARDATNGRGVDVVLEMASGQIGDESFKLLAPFGRVVFFGARNYNDSISSNKIKQLIATNLSIVAFNFPTWRTDEIQIAARELFGLIIEGRIKLFADNVFPLTEAKQALDALSSRSTIGKVVLVP
jgi:NADPH:quinone reductase